MAIKKLEKFENGQTYTRHTKKRKKFIIEYEDGTTEEFYEGIIATVNEDKNGLECKHLNTHGNIEFYAQGLAHISISLMDRIEEMEEFSKQRADDEDFEKELERDIKEFEEMLKK